MSLTPPFAEKSTPIVTRHELELWQAEQLRSLIQEIVPRNPFWTSKLAQNGISVDSVQRLEDLQRIPFTTKAELIADQSAHPPYGSNLTHPLVEYSRLHQTSGTTGRPLRWLDTPTSWNGLLESWRELFALMGLRRDDRLFFAFSFGPFLGFWAGFEGAQRLGNFCIPAGGMSSEARLNLMRDNKATVVCCTPTYALRLVEVAAQQQIDLKSLGVRALLVAGEPGGNIPATRSRLESAWGAQVVDHWGMTELGPLAIESLEHPGGLFVLETACIAEIIDPGTEKHVSLGDEGELVITNLHRRGSPLIRYRTGDRVRAGRAAIHSHMLYLPGGILGRVDEMLTIRGNNLYPSALEDVIRGFDNVAEFRIEMSTVKSMQHLKIEIEPVSQLDESAVALLIEQIGTTIKLRWHFQADVAAVPPGTLPRFEMKARRFVRIS